MLIELLIRPRAAIQDLLARPSGPWAIPIVGYASVSFGSAIDNTSRNLSDWDALPRIAFTLAVAFLVGSWAWAGIFGGLLHLSARAFGGKSGAGSTIYSVGCGLFWPGVFSALGAITYELLGEGGVANPCIIVLPLALQVGCGFWAVYTVIAALHTRHAFGWWRAVGSYLAPIVLLVVVVVSIVFVTAVLTSAGSR